MNQSELKNRRGILRSALDGAILLPGLQNAPKNYPKNTYPFRQDSHFLYFVGLHVPELAALIMPDGETVLYGSNRTETQVVWEGPAPTIKDRCAEAGMDTYRDISKLQVDLEGLVGSNTKIHYLPPYRAEVERWLAQLLGRPASEIEAGASADMAELVWSMRAVKSDWEVSKIEEDLKISSEMYEAAARVIAPGVKEQFVAGTMQGVAARRGATDAFQPIVTTNGEVLHNNSYNNLLTEDSLLLLDTGIEIPPFCYGSDITRTYPVSGRFTDRQRPIYETVLAAQKEAIATVNSHVTNAEVHQKAAIRIVQGLKDEGIMKGSPEDAVEAGAHTLFYPHGIGHLLGLDSHDMEDLGDILQKAHAKRTGDPQAPSPLRLRKKLEPGYVITVEPGIYFIPALIDQWKRQNRNPEFINYDVLESYRHFGGIRIEDDILVTDEGCRVLGPPIPKDVDDIARLFNS